MSGFAPFRPLLLLASAALASGLTGCVYTGLHAQTRFWADTNTYGRPAFVIEHTDHLPERRQYVERLRWQYGVGPGTVPIIDPDFASYRRVDAFESTPDGTPTEFGIGPPEGADRSFEQSVPLAPPPLAAPPAEPPAVPTVLPMGPADTTLDPAPPAALPPLPAKPARGDGPPALRPPSFGARLSRPPRPQRDRVAAGGWMFDAPARN